MGSIIIGICEFGYFLWNTFIDFAYDLFGKNPIEATYGEGESYESLANIVWDILDLFTNVAVTLALLFLLVALIKETITSPPGQQLQRLAHSGLKYGIILSVISNMKPLLAGIIEFCDWVTENAMGFDKEAFHIEFSEAAESIVDTYYSNPPGFSIFDIGGSLLEWFEWCFLSILFLILGLVSIIVMFASVIIILNVAFQRIIKPLIIVPFGGLFVAMGAGTGDSERTMWNYLKLFIGFCLSGALMAVCIRLGVALAGSPSFLTDSIDASSTDLAIMTKNMIFMFIQNAMAPLIVAGLVKSVDSILQRIL